MGFKTQLEASQDYSGLKKKTKRGVTMAQKSNSNSSREGLLRLSNKYLLKKLQ